MNDYLVSYEDYCAIQAVIKEEENRMAVDEVLGEDWNN